MKDLWCLPTCLTVGGQEYGIHADFRREVDGFHHVLLEFRAFVALAAVTAGGLMPEGDGNKTLDDGDEFTVHTGEQPPASLAAEVFINRQQNTSGIIAGNDAAFGIGVDVENIVKNRIFGIGNVQTEVLHQAQPEAGFCLGVVRNVDLAGQRHQHPQILLQLLGGVVNGAAQGRFINLVHRVPSLSVMVPKARIQRHYTDEVREKQAFSPLFVEKVFESSRGGIVSLPQHVDNHFAG